MKNPQGIVWAPVLIMVAVVVVAGVAAFYMFQASKPSNENKNVAAVNQTTANLNTNQATNTNVSVNTNTTADTNTVRNTNNANESTAGWKTYTNTTYNISFMYPNDWKVVEGATSTPYKIDVFPNTSSGWSTSGAITFWVGNSYSLRCGESPMTTITETDISGIPAKLYTTIDQKKADCKFRTYQLSRTPTGWNRTDSGSNEIQVMATNTGSYATQDTILGTIKLTDPTAGWKTYTNPARGYSIKYPPTWTATTNSTEPEAVNIAPPEPNPGVEVTNNLIIAPTPKIDASDCRNVDLDDHKSTVGVNGANYIRTVHGCLFDWISTYFPQPSGYTGYFDVTWAKPPEGKYPEYELMLNTFRI